MKISRRGAAAATLALVAALGLSACSAGTGSSASGGTKDVTFWGSWSSAEQVAQINKQVAAFNKDQSQYKVTYAAQNLVEQKLLTGEASGQVPDVVLWDRGQTSLYVSKGALQSIDDLVKKDSVDLDQFYSEPTAEMTVDKKVYGLPILVDNRSLFYNKKILDKAGVSVPTTWDELKNVAQKVTTVEGGKTTVAGFMLDDPGLFNMWLQQAGGTMLNKDESKTDFNNEKGLEVLDFWKSLQQEKVFQQGFGAGTDPFAANKAAMKYDGPWDISTYNGVDGLDYGVAEPLAGPDGDKGAVTGGFGLVVPKGAKNVDGAWAFMKWWATQPANGVSFGKIAGWVPANKEAASNEFFTADPHYAAIVKALSYAKIRPTVAGYSDVEGKALIPALQKFMSGELSAKDALAQAQEQGDQILAQNR
ncbi:ABC transporter substrate-binding protein [Leifsonia poae]|uniref:Sugar ABC transporter substrate-binding protein n=1 Tax=Leifsonia poae TaxID=110933 RepID=A0A9W6LYX5_9MICO|nr:ABC transporter substrate-binding protein [Leifsonia poae]GLJ75315.1 sugar ABC transporter substrate-binding protein [Leifsonia poae]